MYVSEDGLVHWCWQRGASRGSHWPTTRRPTSNGRRRPRSPARRSARSPACTGRATGPPSGPTARDARRDAPVRRPSAAERQDAAVDVPHQPPPRPVPFAGRAASRLEPWIVTKRRSGRSLSRAASALAMTGPLHPEVMRALKNRFDCRDSNRNHGGPGRHSGIPGGSIRWSSEFGYHRSASHARQR